MDALWRDEIERKACIKSYTCTRIRTPVLKVFDMLSQQRSAKFSLLHFLQSWSWNPQHFDEISLVQRFYHGYKLVNRCCMMVLKWPGCLENVAKYVNGLFTLILIGKAYSYKVNKFIIVIFTRTWPWGCLLTLDWVSLWHAHSRSPCSSPTERRSHDYHVTYTYDTYI